MQKSSCLLAILPYLHWFGSLVNGATVLTTPSNLTPILEPPRLIGSRFPSSFNVIDKERGVEVPAAQLFKAGISLMGDVLAPEDFDRNIPSQAWSLGDIILGISVYERWGVVSQYYLLYGLYFIFLLMKQEKDFRSGVFEVQWAQQAICDLIILPTKTSGLHLAPNFTHVTQLDPPPSPIADNINSYSELVIPDLPLLLNVTVIEPYLVRPMDELGELINFVDMLVTVAEPPANKSVQKNTESIVPYSGVKISLNLTHDDPHATEPFTYDSLIWAVGGMSRSADDFVPKGQAFRGQMVYGPEDVVIGEITVVPSNSAAVNASTDTATARKRWSMA